MGRSIISLGRVHETKANENSCINFEELLKPIEYLSLESESDVSEIEDIFEEFHRSSFLRAYADPARKYLTKNEADRKIVEQFTDDFKRMVRVIREETGVNTSLFDEEQAIEEILNSKEVCLKNTNNVDNIGTPISIEPERDEASTSSVESNVWNMLLVNSDDNFKVSPPFFDAFRQETEHWLERPPISWKRINESIAKCEKWLNDVL